MTETEIVLEESVVAPIFEQLAELRSETGIIPEPFLEPLEEEEGGSLFGDPLFEGAGVTSAASELGEFLKTPTVLMTPRMRRFRSNLPPSLLTDASIPIAISTSSTCYAWSRGIV